MKKFLITSACTLAVSLLGTLANPGISQSVKDNLSTLYSNAAAQSVETLQAQNDVNSTDAKAPVNDTANDSTLSTAPAQTDLQASANNTDNTGSNSSDQGNLITTATTEAAKNTAVDSATADNTAGSNTVDAGKTAAANDSQSATSNNKSVKTDNQTTAPAAQNTTSTTPASQANSTCPYKAANGDTLTVKNVDLSNCKNAKEVVKVLQQKGCINKSNVNTQNITSVQDIQALLQGKASANTGSTSSNNNTAGQAQPSGTTTGTKTNTTPATGSTPAKTTTTPASTSDTNSGISSYADQVLQLVNAERAKQGLSALTTTTALSQAANQRAAETSQSFSHTRPNGSSFSTVLSDFGISYTTCGENIAYGQRTPQEVVTGWMNSPGHRANILNGNYNKIGIGVYQASNGTIYWSQEFTN